MKSLENKYKSPQKEINSVSGFISIDSQKKIIILKNHY
jgi:hypothetical protein